MKNLLCLTGILLITIAAKGQDCNLNDNAQRYFARANAAIKEAQNEADFLNAVEEFKKALQYAPDCADIYYNIAFCYDKSASSELLKDNTSLSQAISFYKKYLELKPNAQNKQAVQSRIYELEYKYDRLNDELQKLTDSSLGGSLANHPDINISGLYKSGKKQQTTGTVFLLTGVAIGAIGYLALENSNDYRGVMLAMGCGTTIVSIPIMISGNNKMKKAKRLYNESHKNERRSFSDVKVGFTGNSVGLTFAF